MWGGMSRILDDLQEIPQDWFAELPKDEQPNKDKLQSVDIDLYQSECPGLLGNMVLELFLGEDGFYYMLMETSQPIGDYGTTWVDYWYKCEKQYISEIEKILKGGVRR